MARSTTHFGTYAEARRTFVTALSEEFSSRRFMHQMIILDYSHVLRWDVAKDMSFLRSLGDRCSADNAYAAAAIERWGSCRAVEQRWPYRVPADCGELSKDQLELVCREMWSAIRVVGKTALVLGEGKPGDAAFSCTADGYGACNYRVSSGSLGLYRSILRWMGAGVGAGKSIKQD